MYKLSFLRKRISKFNLLLCLLILCSFIHTEAQKLEKYFEKNQPEKAEAYCAKQKGEKQKECFKELADEYLKKENYDKAENFYKKTNNPYAGYLKLADAYFEKEIYEIAGEYYEKARSTEKAKESWIKAADVYLMSILFENHSIGVLSVNISSDNAFIVIGRKDNTIKLYGLEDRNIVRSFDHASQINSIGISNDNIYLISSGGYNSVMLWDIEKGECFKHYIENSDKLYAAISPDNKFVVSCNSEMLLDIWELQSGENVKRERWMLHANITTIAITFDNKYIVAGNGDNTISLWEISEGYELRKFKGHTDRINSLAISSDNKYIVSGSSDNTVKLWSLETGEEVGTFKGHSDLVNTVVISSDNKYIVSGSSDKTVKLWDTESKKEIRYFNVNNEVSSVAISANNKFIVSGSYEGDNTIMLWHLENGKEIITNYHKAIEFYQKAGQINELYKKIENTCFKNNEYDELTKFYKIASVENKEKLNQAYKKIADTLFIKENYDKAAEYYEKSGYINGINKIASNFLRLKKYDDAAKYYLSFGGKDALNKVADDAFNNNEYKIAGNLYFEAENINKSVESFLILEDYNTISELYKSLGNNEKSKEYFIKDKLKSAEFNVKNENYYFAAIEYEEIGYMKEASKYYSLLGDKYFKERFYGAAIDYYKKAGNDELYKKTLTIINNFKKYASLTDLFSDIESSEERLIGKIVGVSGLYPKSKIANGYSFCESNSYCSKSIFLFIPVEQQATIYVDVASYIHYPVHFLITDINNISSLNSISGIFIERGFGGVVYDTEN